MFVQEPECNHTVRENRNGELFSCLECEHEANTDGNAAVNMTQRESTERFLRRKELPTKGVKWDEPGSRRDWCMQLRTPYGGARTRRASDKTFKHHEAPGQVCGCCAVPLRYIILLIYWWGMSVRFGSFMRCLVVLTVVAAIAVTVNQADAAGSMGVVGSIQAVLDEPGVGPLTDVAAFTAPDGRPYLVVVGDSETVHIVDVANPYHPVLTGAVSNWRFIDMGEKNVEVFELPGGHAHAVVTGDNEAYILNVTNPGRPVLVGGTAVGGTADDSHTPVVLRGTSDIAMFDTPGGHAHALALGLRMGLAVVDLTDPLRPAVAEGPPGLDVQLRRSIGAAFTDSSGNIHAVAIGNAADIYVATMTDTLRPTLASVVRYGDGMSLYTADESGPDDGLAVRVVIPPTLTLPEHADIRIAGADGAGLYGASDVIIMETPNGRVYAVVANDSIVVGHVQPQDVPAGILFLDITDPAQPVLVGAVRDGEGGFDMGHFIDDMAVLEQPDRTYLAVVDSDILWMLDITDPAQPVLVGAVRDGEGGFDSIGGTGMAVLESSMDGRLYLATVGYHGIRLVDVTDPAKPVPAGTIPGVPESFYTTGGAEYTASFSLVGRTYALGTGGDGIHILDVTDPAKPVPAGSAWDGRDGFDALDAAHLVAAVESPDGPFLAAVAGREVIQILDIVNPAKPVQTGAIRYEEGGLDPQWVTDMASYLSPDGRDYLLVADHNTGIHMVDITDPTGPVLVDAGNGESGAVHAGDGRGYQGGCPEGGNGVHGVDIYRAYDGRDYVLMACDRSISILDISRPTTPKLAGTLSEGMGNNTFETVYWTTLYEPPGGGIFALLADYGSGTHIVNVTDPHNPIPAGSVPLGMFAPVPGTPVRVVASGDRVLALAAGVGGIHVLDVTDPHYPAHTDFLFMAGMGLLPFDSLPRYLTTFESGKGETHVLVDGGEGALVLNMPPHPQDGGDDTVVDMGWNGGVTTHGGHILVLVGAGHIIYVAGPELVIEFEWDLTPVGSDGIVEIVDLNDPGAPSIIGTLPSLYGRPEVEVVYSPEGRAYGMAVGPAGSLLVATVAGPDAAAAPFIPHDLILDMPIETFRSHDGRVYMMAVSGDGIRVIDVTYPANPVQVSHIRDDLNGFYYLADIRDISAFESGDGLVYALVASGDGMQVMDVTNPYRPLAAGGLRESSTDGVHRIATVGTSDGSILALAAWDTNHTTILDITHPHHPVLVATIHASIAVYEDATVGMQTAPERYAGERGAKVYMPDLFMHKVWERDSAGADSGHVYDVAAFEASDGRIYALISGSLILDITNPATPVPVVAMEGLGIPDTVSAFKSHDGRSHVLLAGDGTIWVIDLDDPTWLYDWVWP